MGEIESALSAKKRGEEIVEFSSNITEGTTGEIDFITRHGEQMYFYEVKAGNACTQEKVIAQARDRFFPEIQRRNPNAVARYATDIQIPYQIKDKLLQIAEQYSIKIEFVDIISN